MSCRMRSCTRERGEGDKSFCPEHRKEVIAIAAREEAELEQRKNPVLGKLTFGNLTLEVFETGVHIRDSKAKSGCIFNFQTDNAGNPVLYLSNQVELITEVIDAEVHLSLNPLHINESFGDFLTGGQIHLLIKQTGEIVVV